MSRGVGVVDALEGALPEWTAVVLGLITQLGDVWFLSLVAGAFYLGHRGDRAAGVALVGLTLAGLGAVTGLKAWLGLPRPGARLADPAAIGPPWDVLLEVTATADGYGFPSGHALLTTVVLLGIARRSTWGTPRWRYGLAGGLVTVVAATRVALGLHYLVDVIAGIAIGLALLFAVEGLIWRHPARGASVGLLAGILATGGAYLVAGSADAALLLGAALGAAAGWHGGRNGASRLRGEGPLVDGPILGLAALVTAAAAGLWLDGAMRAALALGGFLGVGIAIAVPLVYPGPVDRAVAAFLRVGSRR